MLLRRNHVDAKKEVVENVEAKKEKVAPKKAVKPSKSKGE